MKVTLKEGFKLGTLFLIGCVLISKDQLFVGAIIAAVTLVYMIDLVEKSERKIKP